MANKQRNYSSEFKVKVVLEAGQWPAQHQRSQSRPQSTFIGDQPLAQ